MPRRIQTYCPLQPRSQRPAGSASLGHGGPIPGTYYTNPVFFIAQDIHLPTIYVPATYLFKLLNLTFKLFLSTL